MTTYKRFSVQILGTVDGEESVALHQAIQQALAKVKKFKVKAISLDEWTDGFTGKTRKFDENGDEVVEIAEVVTTEIKTA